MIDVGGYDGPPRGHFAANKLRVNILPQCRKTHFLSDATLPGVVHLGAIVSRFVATRSHPRLPPLGQPLARIHALWTAGVVHLDRGKTLRLVNQPKRDLKVALQHFVRAGKTLAQRTARLHRLNVLVSQNQRLGSLGITHWSLALHDDTPGSPGPPL